MKFTLAALVFLVSTTVFAAPKVVCDAMSYETEVSGAMIPGTASRNQLKVISGQNLEVPVGMIAGKPILLNVVMTRICAQDGGPCTDNTDLQTSLTLGASQSTTSMTLTPATRKFTRQHLTLRVGRFTAFVNCDTI